ncbi:hypothetical protein [Rothia mucilaginosa]
MPNTPRSYNDIKKLAGEVPAPVALESIYRVTAPISDSKRRDLEIKALRRSLNSERTARYKLEYELARMRINVVYPCVIITILAVAAIATTAH